MAGYSGTPLWKKLGIKEGSRVLLCNAPQSVADKLQESVRATFEAAPAGMYDVILSFESDLERLEERFAQLTPNLKDRGGLWISWPKKSSPLAVPGLSENPIRDIGLAIGLVDNKVCAVDEHWSGLRFVRRLSGAP